MDARRLQPLPLGASLLDGWRGRTWETNWTMDFVRRPWTAQA
jgi:hypothetical protein